MDKLMHTCVFCHPCTHEDIRIETSTNNNTPTLSFGNGADVVTLSIFLSKAQLKRVIEVASKYLGEPGYDDGYKAGYEKAKTDALEALHSIVDVK